MEKDDDVTWSREYLGDFPPSASEPLFRKSWLDLPHDIHESIAAKIFIDRNACVRELLGYLCLHLQEATNIISRPKWVYDAVDDVVFQFNPKKGQLLVVAMEPEIAEVAKRCWLSLRARFPQVFDGAEYEKLVKSYRLSAAQLAALPDEDFARVFQKHTDEEK